jgi:hypothetical protein
MRFKHELACWRPFDFSHQVQPVVTTPGHGTLPSGHCVEAYVIKEVLEALLRIDPRDARQAGLSRQFSRTAARIAVNRVVAGVHFPVDNLAGRLLGTVLGRYFAFCCRAELPRGSPSWRPAAFLGNKCTGDEEFEPERQPLLEPDSQPLSPAARIARPDYYRLEEIPNLENLEPCDSVLRPMWLAAEAELDKLQLRPR